MSGSVEVGRPDRSLIARMFCLGKRFSCTHVFSPGPPACCDSTSKLQGCANVGTEKRAREVEGLFF